jgi:chemotaxis signal transduction protein
MAVKKKNSVRASAKALAAVSVYLDAEEIQGRKPVLLFTAGQIDEVLADTQVHPLPFASEYLLGLCAWRNQALPIIDPVRFFGLTSSGKEAAGRYVVVRMVSTISMINTPDALSADTERNAASNAASAQKCQLLRCVLKVSDRIISGKVAAQCEAVVPKQLGFASVFVRGLFQSKRELFILPDLTGILHSDSA